MEFWPQGKPFQETSISKFMGECWLDQQNPKTDPVGPPYNPPHWSSKHLHDLQEPCWQYAGSVIPGEPTGFLILQLSEMVPTLRWKTKCM